MKIKWKEWREVLPTMRSLIKAANEDKDKAHIQVLGHNDTDAYGCIIVVKGNQEYRMVEMRLKELGLISV